MFLKHKELTIAFLILVGIFAFSYFTFTTYKPKNLVQVEEVRGLKTDKSNSLDLPYPAKSEDISITKTSAGTEQVTFKTPKTMTEVQEYYKNIMGTLNWKMDSEAAYDYSTVSRFSHDDSRVTVMAFNEEGKQGSLVGIEISH